MTFKAEHGYATSTPLFDGLLGLGASNADGGGQEVWEEDTYEGTGWF